MSVLPSHVTLVRQLLLAAAILLASTSMAAAESTYQTGRINDVTFTGDAASTSQTWHIPRVSCFRCYSYVR